MTNLTVTIPTKEDIDIMARTVYGEARGEGWEGEIAVAWVIKNRARIGGWWGSRLAEVCKKPYQFSCWNVLDPNSSLVAKIKLDTSLAFQQCLAAVSAAIYDIYPDPTMGATHYHAITSSPKWAKDREPLVRIGNHVFYKDIA